MSTTTILTSETIKNSIKQTAEKSKETIREIINNNSKLIDSAIENNKAALDSIRKNIQQQNVEDSISYPVKDTFAKSVELAENSIDAIINVYLKQVEWNIKLNTELIDSLNENFGTAPEKTLKLIFENFEATHQQTVNNTKSLIEFYNKHTNLAVNFNKKFADNIFSQVETLKRFQYDSYNKLSEWTSEWWKETVKAEKV